MPSSKVMAFASASSFGGAGVVIVVVVSGAAVVDSAAVVVVVVSASLFAVLPHAERPAVRQSAASSAVMFLDFSLFAPSQKK